MEWEGSILRKFDANEGNCVDAKPVFPLSLTLPPSFPLFSPLSFSLLLSLLVFSFSLVFFLEEGNTRFRRGRNEFLPYFPFARCTSESSLISTSSSPNIDKQSKGSGCCHWNPHGVILNFAVRLLRSWTILIEKIGSVFSSVIWRTGISIKSQ